MPAVLAQASILVLIYSLAVWTGCALFITALLPKPSAHAKIAAKGAPARILLLGLPVSSSVAVFILLFRTGNHNLKLLGMFVVLVAFMVACFGTAGVAQRFADWLDSRQAMSRYKSGALTVVIAAVIVAAPIALPKIGLLIILPLLFTICGGIGASALIHMASKKTQQLTSRRYVGKQRTILLAVGVLLTLCIVPLWRALSVERDTIAVGMADGTHLAADVYVPAGLPPYPVILIQTPNNRLADKYNVEEGVRHGYAVVVEDTRGRYTSEGDNLPFSGLTDERPNDGWDTLAWLGGQPWCSGVIGTLGTADEGIAQIALDGAGTDRIASQHVAATAPSLYQYIVYPGGIFRKNVIETWLKESHYSPKGLAEWVAHPTYDNYWIARDFSDRWDRINWPVMHIGGWYDIASQGTIDTFVGFQTHGSGGARGKQKLIIGPWGHDLYRSSIGDLTFPDGAEPNGKVQDPWRWFDYSLKAKQNGLEKLPAVTYYVMGDTSTTGAPGNVWRTADAWPPVETTDTPYYLHAGKQLSTASPGSDPPASYVFDPKNPVPTIGGPQLYLPDGPLDQRKITERSDVLIFATGELAAPTELTGRVKMKLYISSDSPDTDFFVKLCDLYTDGRSFNICEGQLRARFRYGLLEEELLKPGEVYPLEIDLSSTSVIINRGHKLQVIVTSSNSPGFDVNPNTGAAFRADARTQVAHNIIYMDAVHPSAIILPVAKQ